MLGGERYARALRHDSPVSLDLSTGIPDSALLPHLGPVLASLHELPGWSALGPGIDHVLVRGLPAGPLVVWPEERRSENGRVLSDHAPVEVTVG